MWVKKFMLVSLTFTSQYKLPTKALSESDAEIVRVAVPPVPASITIFRGSLTLSYSNTAFASSSSGSYLAVKKTV